MKRLIIILACLVAVACIPHKPIDVKPPVVDPPVAIESWLKTGQAACGEGSQVPDEFPSIVDAWNVATTVQLFRDTVSVAGGIEIGIHTDVHWLDPDTHTVAEFWAWLQEVKPWTCWGPPNKAVIKGCHVWQCPEYSLADQLRTAHYCGLWIELNIDTSGAWYFDDEGRWCGNYHYGRLNPAGGDSGKVARFTVKIIKAMERYAGFTPNAIFVENEPWMKSSQRVKEYTMDEYLDHVARMSHAVKSRWPDILIGAGATGHEWGVAAWRKGKVDYVGCHVVYPKSVAEYAVLRKAFKDAGVPLGVVAFDEVVDRAGVGVAIRETLGHGALSLYWTTIAALKKSVAWKVKNIDAFKAEVDANMP